MLVLEQYQRKVNAVKIMRERNFQDSTIVQVLEDKTAIEFLLKNPTESEAIVLSIAQME